MNLKKILSAVCAIFLTLSSTSTSWAYMLINGAGATFPYPIYSKWFDEYHKLNPEVRVNYQAIGSSGGIRQFTDGTVIFGASDGPMSDVEIAKIKEPVLQLPTVLGAVVPAFNIPGVENLNFTGEVLAGIYLGDITTWDDAAIKSINPGVNLPQSPITVVHRSDGSGTTYCFTDYLSAVSPMWKGRTGKGQSVNWPVGLGAKGNEGVSGILRGTPNSIGYIELLYAKQNRMSYGAVKNQAGVFVKADVESVAAAGASVKMPEDFRISIVNATGEKSYPIFTFTWILVKQRNSGETGAILKGFFVWMLDQGQAFAPKLEYAPLPADVNAMVQKAVSTIQ